jgi:hypothetical protein
VEQEPWYTFANEIFAEFEIDKSDFEAFSTPFKIAKISIKFFFKNLFMTIMKNN